MELQYFLCTQRSLEKLITGALGWSCFVLLCLRLEMELTTTNAKDIIKKNVPEEGLASV
jgi:hypothetical protein